MADVTSESGLRPITMQDVRLAVGEGPLKPADVLAGCNAELARRRALISPVGEVVEALEPVSCAHEAYQGVCAHCYAPMRNGFAVVSRSAAPRGMEG